MDMENKTNGSDKEKGPAPDDTTRSFESAYRPPPVGVCYPPPPRRLYRSTRNKWLGGVCGGLAEYFNRDPTLIRLLWVVLTLISVGVGIIAYLVFWVVVDKDPSPYGYPGWVQGQQEEDSVHYHYHY